MKIMLIQPPIEDFYTTPIRFYPLGLLYAAAVLEKYGHTVQVLDCLTPLHKKKISLPAFFKYLEPLFAQDPLLFQHYYRFGLPKEQIMEKISSFDPDMIGISANFTAYYDQVDRLVRLIRTTCKANIFIGGHHAAAFAPEIKKRTPQIDRIVEEPAETGLAFLTQNESTDWTTLTPAHHLVQTGTYRIGRKNSMSLIASRGCPFQCSFCSVHRMFGRMIQYRRIDDVIDEMRWNYDHHDVRIFNFEDDNLSCNNEWFNNFLDTVINEPALQDIELLAMNGLSHTTLTPVLLHKMRRAGFRQLNLSLVTRDERMRRSLQRPGKMQEFEELIRCARELNFFITVYIIIGLPQQTYAEVRDSIDYLDSLHVLIGPSVFYIPPASALYGRLNLPQDTLDNWNLYRSSAFAVETAHLNRAQLVELFCYARAKNLQRRK